MDPATVHRAITNSDDSFDALLSSTSQDSRDEMDSNRPSGPLTRDAAAPSKPRVVVLHPPSLGKKHKKDSSDCFLLASPTIASLAESRQHAEDDDEHDDDDDERQAHDDASFTFFGRSFDSISHTTDLNDSGFQDSPMAKRRTPQGVDISLPSLSHGTSTMQDISPIKVGPESDSCTLIEPIPFQYCQQHEEEEKPQQPPPITSTGSLPYGYQEDRSSPEAYSNPLYVLRSCSQAFSKCTFLLSHIRNHNPLPVHFSAAGPYSHYQNPQNVDLQYYDARDLEVASRRVKSAVCAFGGAAAAPFGNRNAIFRGVTPWAHQYKNRLAKRYHLNGKCISWEMEEHPPIEIESESKSPGGTIKQPLSPESTQRDSPIATTTTPSPSTTDDPPKMKYRCKLCGQPKQAHNCPFRHSMQRSIGVTVHPAANAYTAHEPGLLAPALSEMNNFVEFPSGDAASSGSSPEHLSPTPSVEASDGTKEHNNRKRTLSDMTEQQQPRHVSPFLRTAPLCREQYRAVSHKQNRGPRFEYPPVPLSFNERKRLSDTLWALTKEMISVTHEVAAILHQARNRDMWDLAVAEILTQIIVALYCVEGDKRLDGLSRYLLGIGVAC